MVIDSGHSQSLLKLWLRAYNLLDNSLKRQVHRWLAISVVGRAVQSLNVLLVVPFVSLLSNPELITSEGIYGRLYTLSGAEGYTQFLLLVSGFIIFIYLCTAVTSGIEVWYGSRLSNEIGHDFAVRLYQNFMRRTYDQHLVVNLPEATELVTRTAKSCLVGILITGVEVVSNLGLIGLIVAMLMLADPAAALTSAVVLTVAYFVIYLIFVKRVQRIGKEKHQQHVSLLSVVQQSMLGFRDMQIHRAEARFESQQRKLSRQQAGLATRFALIEFIPRQLLEVVVFVGIIVFAIVTVLVRPDSTGVFPLIALYGIAAYRLVPALREVFRDFDRLHSEQFTLQRIEDELQIKSSESSVVSYEATREKTHLIEFEAVSYRYPGADRQALQAVSLALPLHQTTALMGPSGSGKSTIIDLMAGLITPASGSIRVLSPDSNSVQGHHWKERVGYISQSVFLFDGSIRENIMLRDAVNEADKERVNRVCDLAQLAPYLQRQKAGLDTPIGHGSQLLSGGELKRLGLARALFREPELLIVDEAFAQLDVNTQSDLLDTLDSLQSVTVLIVTHDPVLAKRCDNIIDITGSDFRTNEEKQ